MRQNSTRIQGARMTCLAILTWALAVAVVGWAADAKEEALPVPNGGFEEQQKDWQITEFEGVTTKISDEQAASGKYSLKVVDTHAKNGSDAKSALVAIPGPGNYELRGMVYGVSGDGLGMYVSLYDKAGKRIEMSEPILTGVGGSDKKWRRFGVNVPVYDQNIGFLQVWVHSYSHAKVEAYLDDLVFVRLGDMLTGPPWPAQYKIKAGETAKITAADVVGPDGLVYPNWTKCGVEGGIPEVKPTATIEEFGGKANDDADDSVALDAACRAVGEKGGGAVMLGEGTYYLDWPVTVRHDRVVIRGAGAEKTRLLFRFKIPAEGVGFYTIRDGDTIYPDTYVAIQALPTDLQKMTLTLGGVAIVNWTRSQHSGNTFEQGTSLWKFASKLPKGEKITLKGVAEYTGGKTRTNQIQVIFDAAGKQPNPQPYSQAAITFQGRGPFGDKMELARDGKRGDTTIEVKKVVDLKAGDTVFLDGPATERWKALTKNQCLWGAYRCYQLRVEKIEGNLVTVNQPLRIEFPVIDGSYIRKIEPRQYCGIEDMYIEQLENLWITTVQFREAWNCWGRGVTVKMCGRNPIYGARAKFCEIRDCVFDDAWFKGGGGTAYTGWEYSWDCLMDNVTTYKMRHAPLFQWSASGNVIRKGTFHESDGQWHSGWTNENLFEQCVITSTLGHGSYGFGMWGSPPEDTAHGPNGPRNVIYNCDVYSVKSGLWMGGMNEAWMILHNRFVVEKGVGVHAKTCSFDHTIRGNVFVLKDGKSPMTTLATPDCFGIELVGNKTYGGSGKISNGMGKPFVAEENEFFPLQENAPRPQPAVPSIYQWQLQNVRK